MFEGGPVYNKLQFLVEDEIPLISRIYTMCVRKENRVRNCLIPLL